MDEAFLHFIWKFQKYNSIDLRTVDEEEVSIYTPGFHNQDSGPDFQNARIKIDGLEWNGHVEIHLRSVDWHHHRHEQDAAYNNVVLHVVWQNNAPTLRLDGSKIPTIELKERVNPQLLSTYKKYRSSSKDILCEDQLPSISRMTWVSHLDRMLSIRLEEKSRRINAIAAHVNHDWEEVAYQVLARTFGFSLNSDVFEQMSQTLPLKVIAKHADQPFKVEALVFGQAGFLQEPIDEYARQLKIEYDFLSQKYGLDLKLHRTHWKFGKMRPSNFPTVRLAQFAGILSSHPALFSIFREVQSVAHLKKILNAELSTYWQSHYDFDKPLKKGQNQMGTSSLEILIINAVTPLLAAFSTYTDQPDMMEKATAFLEQLPAESNRYTEKWSSAGRMAKSAFDSQAQITLFKDFCSHKKCLTCAIGAAIFSK